MADTGLILKGVGGFYTVLSDNGTEWYAAHAEGSGRMV